MKTIFVVYTDEKNFNVKACKVKKYAFNTENDVKVGDILKSSTYDTNMVVTDVLDKAYKYYNNTTGELSDVLNSTALRSIKTMDITDKAVDVVIARKTGEVE